MPDTPIASFPARELDETVEEFMGSDRFIPFVLACFNEGIKRAVERDKALGLPPF